MSRLSSVTASVHPSTSSTSDDTAVLIASSAASSKRRRSSLDGLHLSPPSSSASTALKMSPPVSRMTSINDGWSDAGAGTHTRDDVDVSSDRVMNVDTVKTSSSSSVDAAFTFKPFTTMADGVEASGVETPLSEIGESATNISVVSETGSTHSG